MGTIICKSAAPPELKGMNQMFLQEFCSSGAKRQKHNEGFVLKLRRSVIIVENMDVLY